MKKLLVLIPVLLFMAGCGETPKSVTNDFMSAMKDADFEKAATYADPQTKQMLTLVQGMLNDQQKEALKNTEFEVVSCEENGDTAKCIVKQKNLDTNRETQSEYSLKKIDGKWKISVNKKL